MNHAFHLFRLQQIDTQIDQAQSSLDEINRLLAGDETVRQASEMKETAARLLNHTQQALKQAEFAVKEQQIKIGQSEASLYSGRIHNPKELQDIQKEIASLKKHLATLEDHQLEAMVAQEEAEEKDKTAEQDLLRAQAAFTEMTAGWQGQKEQITRNLERLQAERQASLSLISEQSMKAYNNLRKSKRGVAVTIAKEGSCSVCGGNIRPSELQTARSAPDLVYCSSCGRILYAG